MYSILHVDGARTFRILLQGAKRQRVAVDGGGGIQSVTSRMNTMLPCAKPSQYRYKIFSLWVLERISEIIPREMGCFVGGAPLELCSPAD